MCFLPRSLQGVFPPLAGGYPVGGRAARLDRGPAYPCHWPPPGQVSMLGLAAGSGTRCAGGSGSTTADSTVRSGRTWTSSPDVSMRQPCSPSSSSDATTTEGSACSSGAFTEEVVLRACRPVAPAG